MPERSAPSPTTPPRGKWPRLPELVDPTGWDHPSEIPGAPRNWSRDYVPPADACPGCGYADGFEFFQTSANRVARRCATCKRWTRPPRAKRNT